MLGNLRSGRALLEAAMQRLGVTEDRPRCVGWRERRRETACVAAREVEVGRAMQRVGRWVGGEGKALGV